MKHHTLHIFCCLALGLLGLLASCYDEGWGGEPTLPVAAGEAVVKVSVPAGGGFGTRADSGNPEDGTATAGERAIHSLWFLAYPMDGENGETLVCPLYGSSTLEHDAWRTYNVRMKLGKYTVYVVANVEGISARTTEDQLKNMTLNYTDEQDNLVLPDVKKGLPMVYQSKEPFEVTAQGGTIEAMLEFTCVKVTYTLTFDNTKQTGHSYATFGENYLTVEDVTGKQVPPTSKLLLNIGNRVARTFDCDEEALKGSLGSDATPGRWTYSATFYLPEHYVDKDKQDEQTYLDMTAALYSEGNEKRADLQYTIPLGGLEDLNEENEDTYDRSELRRGTWYRITGNITTLGGVIEPTVVVVPWETAKVDTDLESAYHLWVEQTALTQELPAGTAKTIACRTDAPKLEASSSKITVDGEEIDLFVVTLNRENGAENGDYTGFTVQVNPAIPPTEENQKVINAAQDKCIWLHIPDPETNKYLLSKRIDIKTVKLDPYFVVTPPQYTIYLTEIGHEETYPVTFTYETNMTNVEVTCGEDDVLTGDGIKWDGNKNVTIENSGLQANGTGTVTVTLDSPYDPSLYTRTQTITIDYVATDNRTTPTTTRTAQTTVTIIPNAQTYRLHFRPVDDSWTNPHIYVYQVLYTPDGKEVLLADNGEDRENAVLYSFTGMRTFKGWQAEGGDQVNGNWKGTGSGVVYGDKAIYLPDSGSGYHTNIDYCPEFHGANSPCIQCQSSTNARWPGVRMKADTENPGWFYFDLPALADPGTTLIMFANTHSGDIDNKNRYPARYVPGVPLYDYADKDGWFLYDYTKGNDNGFVDDKPDIPAPTIYRININGNTQYNRIHVWINGGADITNWDLAYTGVIQSENGQRYFEFSRRPDDIVSGSKEIRYKFVRQSGNEYDGSIGSSSWSTATGKYYDYEYTIN